ncbi:transcription termination factor, mitochondrial [Onthophagus taurus]|uniref:transcription termination factor, mitochondrial n=1 Tax=Onthophagus taurus TaxID=166361 RepID=UPI0039BEA223
MNKLKLLHELIRLNTYKKPAINYTLIRCVKTDIQKKEEKDIIGIAKEVEDFKISRSATIRRLVYLFGVDQNEALDMVSKHKQLCYVTGHLLNENYKLCVNAGMRNPTILKCVDVLVFDDLPLRLSILSKIGPINNMAPLLTLPPPTLLKLQSEFAIKGNVIYKLAELLEVSSFEISKQFVKKTFLLRLNFEKVSQIIELFKQNNITGQMVANDLTALRYSLPTIKNRIEFAKTCGVLELKTWMIRVDPQIFQQYIKIRLENKEIIGNKSVAEYLSERLDCSLATANYLVYKLPALNNKSVKKMSELIDFLYAQGYTPGHICRVPKILLHSIETTKKRLKILNEIGVQVNTMYVLIKSQKSFQEYYDNLVKNLMKRNKIQKKP